MVLSCNKVLVEYKSIVDNTVMLRHGKKSTRCSRPVSNLHGQGQDVVASWIKWDFWKSDVLQYVQVVSSQYCVSRKPLKPNRLLIKLQIKIIFVGP